jgi:hypothetical protein
MDAIKRAGEREGEGGAPVLTALEPNEAPLGAPSFTLRVQGQGFSATDAILWNGSPEPTTFVSPQEVTTGVNMDTATNAVPCTVEVRNAAGGTSNALTFTFREAGTAPAPGQPTPHPHTVETILASPGESNARAVRAADPPPARRVQGDEGPPEPGATNDRAARDGVVPPDERQAHDREAPTRTVQHDEPGASNARASRDGINREGSGKRSSGPPHGDPERARSQR